MMRFSPCAKVVNLMALGLAPELCDRANNLVLQGEGLELFEADAELHALVRTLRRGCYYQFAASTLLLCSSVPPR